jgi:hypothetical protein
MNALKDRRIIAAIGGGAVLLFALLVAVFALRSHKPAAAGEAGQAAAGLQIEQGQADSRTGATRQLRCFVNGQFTGMETVADCAKKNGVAAQALDVGLDPATGQATTGNGSLAPPVQAPPPAPAVPASEPKVEDAASASAATAECLRYGPEGWRSAGGGVSLGQCTRTLFDGHCEHAGEALYGRWGQQTLRLVTGRVEMSSDNRTFHPLASQNAQDCSLPSG